MRLLVYLALGLLVMHHAYSSYLALAPQSFRKGWPYPVQVTVTDVPSSGTVTIFGNIKNSRKVSVAQSAQITLNNGQSQQLVINVPSDFSSDFGDSYTFNIEGSGGLDFINSTAIKLTGLTYITLIQTDKKLYKAGQTVKYRVLVVDKDLIPQRIAKTILIENPGGSALVKINDDGTKDVYQGTFQLSPFPDLGDWKISVRAMDKGISQDIIFSVDEYVLPKFEVKADVTPGYVLKEYLSRKWVLQQTRVIVAITAKYTYGKGVTGDFKLKTGSQEINGQITDSNGKKDVEIDLSKEMGSDMVYEIPITVEVTDVTTRMYSTVVMVPVESQPLKMEFDQALSDQVYRTGMPIHVVLKVTNPVGEPIGSKLAGDIVTMTLTYYDQKSSSLSKSFPLSAEKTMYEWDIENVNSTRSSLSIQATVTMNGRDYSAYGSVQLYETVGPATLDLRWKTYSPALAMGSTLTFVVDVSASDHFTSLTYMIVSRGNIQDFGTAVVGDNNVIVTTEMCPNGHLIVYGITSDVTTKHAEIIADSLDLRLEHCQNKKVDVNVPVSSVRTGTETTISFDVAWTDPNKQTTVGEHDVYMLAFDQSIQLLKGDNDLDAARVEGELGQFDLQSDNSQGEGPIFRGRRKRTVFPPYRGGAPTSTGELLKGVGLVILANINMKDEEPMVYYDGPVFAVAERGGVNNAADIEENEVVDDGAVMEKEAGSTVAAETVTVRQNFVETWIWETAQTDSNGQLSITRTVPDTITSWIISAFAIRDDTELAVTTNPFMLKAFNPFFVSLNLPYSIRRTEKFELRATVFNYENTQANTEVTLTPSEDFSISGDNVKTVMVESNSAASVTFVIVASKVKTISLNVIASGSKPGGTFNTDNVTKKLIVKPEGLERRRAITEPVILTADMTSFDTEIELDFSPWTLEDIIPDSRRVSVKVTGDMMGNALNGIDDLVQQPYGCGEQNMITTIPNIYAMKYLTAINDVSLEFREKATGFMVYGYSVETQQYRHEATGGYSAFGESDGTASTWLTSFVVRSFAQARDYIPNTVDLELLGDDVGFLFSRQDESGLFNEDGRVLHTEMQGGTAGGEAFSVYVTLCLLEAKKYDMQIDNTKLSRAINYVRRVADGEKVKTSQFLAAITAYAMALTDPSSPEVKATVQKLVGYVTEGGQAPWEKKDSPSVEPTRSHYSRPAGPSSIEITAYCMLAYNTVSMVQNISDMAVWLQSQQNDKGGFSSTQDTVLALQAISEYAANFGKPESATTVTVTGLDPATPPKTLAINSSNSILLQTMELPDDTTRLRVQVAGEAKGFAVVKVAYFFNTEPTAEEIKSGKGGNEQISLTTTSTMVLPSYHKINTCIHPGTSLKYDNMMMLTMSLPSGFIMDDLQKAKEDNHGVKRLEMDGDEYHIYMDQPLDTCLSFMVEETVKVENRKPGTARLYGYYDPEIESESEIQLALQCPPEGCPDSCVINNNCPDPTSHAANMATVSGFLLAACICLLLSLLLAM